MPLTTRSKLPSEIEELETVKSTDAMTEETKEPTIKDLFKAFTEGNAETQTKLTNIETSISANQKSMEDYIKKNDIVVKDLKARMEKLEGTVKQSENAVTNLIDEVTELKKSDATNKN